MATSKSKLLARIRQVQDGLTVRADCSGVDTKALLEELGLTPAEFTGLVDELKTEGKIEVDVQDTAVPVH
jgi:hypothetical protein